MKKTILSVVLGAASIFGAKAQWDSDQEISQTGKNFYDAFWGPEISEEGNYDFGMFWYGNDEETQPGFLAELNRDEKEKGMEVTITQKLGEYQPFGFVFGDDNGELDGGTPFVMDLSDDGLDGDVFVGAKFTNLSEYTLKFRIALIDTNGVLKNTFNESTDGVNTIYDPTSDAIYAGDFELIIAPGESASFEDEFSFEPYVQFANSYSKFWSQIDSTVFCRPCHDIDNGIDADTNFFKVPGYEDGFNWAAVKGMNITVINNANIGVFYDPATEPDSAEFYNYGPEALENALIRVDYIWLNTEAPSEDWLGTVGLAENAAEIGLTVSPSPASSTVTVSSSIEGSVSVVNAQGIVVLSSDDATFDVSGLADGIYSAVVVSDGEGVASKSFVVSK